ncbi:hypothetical protein Hanom_Chr14g01272541 [Helianthus anomalus]
MVVLRNQEMVTDTLESFSEVLNACFSDTKVYKGEDLLYDRIVTLRIKGILVQIRDNNLYGRVVVYTEEY